MPNIFFPSVAYVCSERSVYTLKQISSTNSIGIFFVTFLSLSRKVFLKTRYCCFLPHLSQQKFIVTVSFLKSQLTESRWLEWRLRTQRIATCQSVRVRVTLQLTVSQSVCLGVEPPLGLMTRYLFFSKVTVLSLWGALSDERVGLSFVQVSP
jgi:hypothetical protein